MTDAATNDPLFAGLNDKSITAIPATPTSSRCRSRSAGSC